MKTFVLRLFSSKLVRLALRRKFAFGSVVAIESDFVSTDVLTSDNVCGEGGSLLMNPWSFPDLLKSRAFEIMPQLVELCKRTINQLLQRDNEPKTPVQYWDEFYSACKTEAKIRFGDEFPDLAVSVALAPFEFAIWDSYGKTYNLPWAKCLGSEFLGCENFSSVVRHRPSDQTLVLHTIGGFDPIDDENLKLPDVAASILAEDQLPKHLLGEIELGGIRAVKPKIFGDFKKNITRINLIDRMLMRHRKERRCVSGFDCYFDANGTIESVSELENLLGSIAFSDADVGRQTINFEQPFSVVNTFAKGFEVRRLQEFCTLSIDESLVSIADVRRAHDHGYNRLGLKACKSITMTLRMAKLARELGMAFDIQDLTQVGRGLIVSASLAAWLGVPMESNGWKNVADARDLLPQGTSLYNGIWLPCNGHFQTGNLRGVGISAL